MKSIFIKINIFLVFCFITNISSQELGPLTPTDLLIVEKLSGYILSPDGKYVIFGVRKWNKENGKSYSHLQCKNIETGEINILTPNIEGQSDTSPQFSSSFPNLLFFQRSNADIKPSIYYIQFPPSQNLKDKNEDLSKRLTNYELPIIDFKIKSKTIAFSTDVYFKCKDMKCSANLIENEKNQSYQVYNNLMMFHWDTWLVEGKGTHVFVQKIELSGNEIILKDTPKDITQNMEINSPPLFTDSTNYELSNDGNMIAFSGHLRNHEEAWTTGFKTYYQNLLTMKSPICITNHTSARTQYPVFSKDGTKIAYLAMKIPDLESEILHFEIYNILTNKLTIIPNEEELSIQGYEWKNDNEIIFYADSYQAYRLFNINLKNPIKPITERFPVKYPDISYNLPYFAINNKNIALSRMNAFDTPEKLVLFKFNSKSRLLEEEIEIVELNKDFWAKKAISKSEMFNFTGGYNETAYGVYLKPINFDSAKTYPVVVLIHGGPEQAWSQSWGTSWNPQMYTSRGYAVIMINPHGSTGLGDKYQDDVRYNWGGVPYEDIMLGVSHILNKYPYLDRTRMCAAGGSYGGYMINWIEGHNDLNETLNKDWTFNCLANHDGIFSHISMFYGTEEIWFPKEEFCDKKHKGCNPWEGPEIRKGFDTYSTERYVNNWKTPMIIIHGGTDYRVQLTEGLSAFTALQMRNIPSEFLFFHEENHWVLRAENQIKWFDEVFNFFDKYTLSNEYEIPKEAEIYKIFNKKYSYWLL